MVVEREHGMSGSPAVTNFEREDLALRLLDMDGAWTAVALR